jgi:transposase
VQWGLAHRDISKVQSIGVDEVLWHRGHKYLTVVYQIDAECKRLLWVGQDRTMRTLLRFFRAVGNEWSAQLRFVCSDMWKPYLRVIAKKASQAIHVLDRFHIAMHMNKAIDEVRAQEARAMRAEGIEVLKHSRWCLLKRPENLTDSWCTKTMRSRIEPMKKVARMLRSHRELLLNWFRAKKAISSGAMEGLNNKLN